jgi:hypothetical protein
MTAQIIDIATRKVTPIGQITHASTRPSYNIEIIPNEDDDGFEWAIFTDSPNVIDEPEPDDVASDLTAIALSLRPPRRTFFERLTDLFLGDPE